MSDPPLIFIAYFGPDRPRAVALHTRLRAEGFHPWCDAVDLIPGDLWDEVIPGRLRAATLILVLISDNPHDGWYARAEIADAIRRVRRSDDRWVIPVVLDGASAEKMPYGLGIAAHVDVHRGDFTGVVDAVRRRLELAGHPVTRPVVTPTPSAPSPDHRGRPVDGAPPIDVNAIVDAAVQRPLDRDLLLSWLPRTVSGLLPVKSTPIEQITSDVTRLVQFGRLDDGEWAIAIWLRQAVRLAGPFVEARVYRDALRALDKRG